MHVLLVEDDPRLSRVVLEGLREDQLTLEHAPDLETARSLASLYPFDAVILDVMLGESENDGFKLAREWRSSGFTAPILFLTARGDIESKVLGLQAGGDDYLTKPFDFRELRARLQALVRRSGGHADPLLKLPGGFTVDVTSHEVMRGGSRVALTPREYALLEGHAVLCVEDDGPGIPEADVSRLLQPFQRGSKLQGSEGAGLGLALVAAVTEQHGGTLSLERSPWGGLRAEVQLPKTPLSAHSRTHTRGVDPVPEQP